MTHVALITTSYPDLVEGKESAGSFVSDFAEALASKTKVTVIAASEANETSVSENLTTVRFQVPKLPLSALKVSDPRNWLAIASTLQAGMQATYKVANDASPDFLFALWALPCGEWARRAGARKGIPFGTWALGSDIWNFKTMPVVKNRLATVLAESSLRFADGYELGDDVSELCNKDCRFLASSRVIQIPPKTHHKASAPYRLGFLGRWHENKGIDLFLDALLSLGEAEWEKISEVRIYGGGKLHKVVHEKSNELIKAGRNVTVGGFLGKNDAMELIAWSDYLVVPSRIESIPVIFSDALQVGTPMIFTPVGDLPRLHRQNPVGEMAPEVSANGIKQAIAAALAAKPEIYVDGIEQLRKQFQLTTSVENFYAAVTSVCSR